MPVPESWICWGLARFAALSVIVSCPVRNPVWVGVNVTEIVHCAPTATLDPQLFIWPKSPVGPVTETVSGAVPELVKTTLLAPLAVLSGRLSNESEVVDTVIPGMVAATVPDSLNVRGLFSAVEVTLSDPLTVVPASAADGANTRLIVQFVPSASAVVDGEGQVFAATWKSLDPVMAGVMPLIPAEPLYWAASVITCAVLVIPPVTEPKLRDVEAAGVGVNWGVVRVKYRVGSMLSGETKSGASS